MSQSSVIEPRSCCMTFNAGIKNLNTVRGYFKEFVIYADKKKSDCNAKSPKTYDNNLRRARSWFGIYNIHEGKTRGVKNYFFSVDCRDIEHNPLYTMYKMHNVNDNTICFYFCLLDIMRDVQRPMTLSEIIEAWWAHIAPLSQSEAMSVIDERTLRNKLKSFEETGILRTQKTGNKYYYSLNNDEIDLESWRDALHFFSETAPLGVVGSYLLDRLNRGDYAEEARSPEPSVIEMPFSFKHLYIHHALDFEIVEQIFEAIKEHRIIHIKNDKRSHVSSQNILPLKIYLSARGGRQYVLALNCDANKPAMYRMDRIEKITFKSVAKNYNELKKIILEFEKNQWGVSIDHFPMTEHIEMTLQTSTDDLYILQRLEHEKRIGTVIKLSETRYKYVADVYSAHEMMPWIRTFMGYIAELTSSNPIVEQKFNDELKDYFKLYGVNDDI